ncbi:MAG: hypothetical protein ACLS9T_08065 [Streptococcus salivarius]
MQNGEVEPIDGGHLIISSEDFPQLMGDNPELIPYVKKMLGSKEFSLMA